MRIAHSAEHQMLNGHYNPFNHFLNPSEPTKNSHNNNQDDDTNNTDTNRYNK